MNDLSRSSNAFHKSFVFRIPVNIGQEPRCEKSFMSILEILDFAVVKFTGAPLEGLHTRNLFIAIKFLTAAGYILGKGSL